MKYCIYEIRVRGYNRIDIERWNLTVQESLDPVTDVIKEEIYVEEEIRFYRRYWYEEC